MTEDTYLAFVAVDDEDGVAGFRGDPETGDLAPLGAAGFPNPSFLAVGAGGDRLYAVNREDGGAIAAFDVDRETGALSRLNRQPTGGESPCHVSTVAGSHALVADYDGAVALFELGEDGRVGERTHLVERAGSGPNTDRQTGPHPHAAVPGPGGRVVYVPDLGTDEVAAYELDAERGRLDPAGSVALHGGAGPRSLAFHPSGRYAYLTNELDSTLAALKRDPDTGALAVLATVSTLPESYDGENAPADVAVHPSGRWAYASNRGHDSVAVFELEDGRPVTADHVSTRGEWPRHFALSPTGAHLFAENRNTSTIESFAVDPETGALAHVGSVEAARPACLVTVAGE